MRNEKRKEEKTSKPKYNMGQISWFMVKLAWTSEEKKVIVLSLLSALLAVAMNLINLYVSPTILSAVERHASIWELGQTIAGFVLGLMTVSAASAYVNANTMYGRISVRSELVNLLNRKAGTTSYPNVYDDGFTKLLAKTGDCVNSNWAPGEAIWTTLTNLVTNFVGFAVYAALMSRIQPLLILVILTTTTVSYFVGNYVNEYGYRHREEVAEYQRHMNYISEKGRDFDYAKDIRLFGLRPWLNGLYGKAMDAYTAFQAKAEGVYIWARILDLVLDFLRGGIAYAYLIALVLGKELSVAEFLLYFSAVGGFTAWISGILGGFGTLYKQSLELSTLRECLEYPEPFRFDEGRPIQAEPGRRYELKLEQVSFRYPGGDRDILTNINLTLHPGEKLAVVGLNGAGKTTLIKLLCGFLDPTEGRVLLDGRDIREFNRRDYYTLFSAVFQSFSILAGTIAANVAQNEENIDMGRVRSCLEKAGLKEKIEALEDGYETHLFRSVYEDAIALSGGETQRLMLARALYKDAPFVVLDEPTAALDPIAESELYQKYNEITGEKSSVYISHRLASTRFCDRIIFVDGGGIREEGTHKDLLKLGGKYAELYEVQSKYYKEGAGKDEEG